jgi:tRNA A-37 threonylcarbamoyl transferase component Bud32/tetratricopeptide (TPR) repeat protein
MTKPISPDDIDLTSDHAGDAARDPFDSIAEEFAERCRRGESPSIAEYAERYPEHAQRIRELLPPVAMMERLKGRLRNSGSAANLHEPRLEQLGEYRIIRELGRGGMGIVYEASQESLGRHVALKVIARHGMLDSKRRQRFQREAQAVARLHHTNIVPIFAAGEYDGLPYYAMQYIRGDGLERLLETWRRDGLERGDEHWRFVARVGIQAAEALQYAHDQGILHRDIKPGNILIDEHQVAWITDFGLAKLAGSDDLTHSGDIVGTLRYLAPEALKGQTDRRGDIYSLGLTLYELLTLRLPFGDLSPSELLRCVTEEQPVRPRKLDRSIPHDLETIVLKATAREPAHRYATAGELADDLRAFVDDRPIRARRASAPERLGRWCRRNKVLAGTMAFAAGMLILALAGVSWGLVNTHRALQRELANVELSLAAFERLFNDLSDPADDGPFADGGSQPPRRHFGPPPDEPGGPPPDRPDGDPGMPATRPPSRGGERPPGRPMRGRPELTEREVAVLESVLDFYDKFAERNETNSRLQGEAARAYRKVAALYRLMGRDPEAEAANARALERFQSLVDRSEGAPEYRYEMARTLALDGPGADFVPAERAEQGLREAIAIVEQLAAQIAEGKQITYAAALSRWNARLASILEERGLTSEAEACYRESIQRDDWLAEHVDDPALVRLFQAKNRDALVRLLTRLGRKDEARSQLEQAAADMQSVTRDGRSLRRAAGPAADRLECLADSYRGLGDEVQAQKLCEQAERIRDRGREDGPHRHGIDGFDRPDFGKGGIAPGGPNGPKRKAGPR